MRCDACAGERATTVLETGDRRFGVAGRFAVVRCDGCGLVRTDPQPGDLGAYYPDGDYYSFRPPAEPTARVRARVRGAYGLNGVPRSQRALAALGRDRLTPGLPPGPPGDVLDVGCGSGEFLLALREAGWRPHGIDISAPAVAAAHEAGLADVRCGDLIEAGYPAERFDAVRFWHSLEHVRSPHAQLAVAHRILRPGGTLTIGVPNFGSLLARRARQHWYYLDVPRHLWHFEPETLANVVERAGFVVDRVRTVSGSTALLGTLDYVRGCTERLVGNRRAWYAVLPLAAALDTVRAGDALELTAVRG
jgi:SAM-dependent methyltransferase